MDTQQLDKVLDLALQLTREEQMELQKQLVLETGYYPDPAVPLWNWEDIGGTLPPGLFGVDAQEWISRSRHEATLHREAALYGEQPVLEQDNAA